jgi:hypothetical protein
MNWKTLLIVETQMTKGHCLSLGTGRHHASNLDLVMVDNHAINKQFHQVSLLGKGTLGQGRLDTLAKGFEPLRHGSHLDLLLGLSLKLVQLVA